MWKFEWWILNISKYFLFPFKSSQLKKFLISQKQNFDYLVSLFFSVLMSGKKSFQILHNIQNSISISKYFLAFLHDMFSYLFFLLNMFSFFQFWAWPAKVIMSQKLSVNLTWVNVVSTIVLLYQWTIRVSLTSVVEFWGEGSTGSRFLLKNHL